MIFEGLNATEATGAFGNYPDIGGMEEVQINTAAHSAEASTPGVQSQFISKSGGNQFRGTFFGGYSPESWQAFNIDADQIARGLQGGGGLEAEDVNRLNQLPGHERRVRRLRRSRIGSGGTARTATRTSRPSYVNFPVKPQTTILNNYSAKVTYNLSTNNKFIGYTQPSQKKQPQRFDSLLLGVDTGINTTEATTWNQNFWAWVHKAEWNGVLSDNAFAEIRGGQYGYDWTNGVNGTGPALRGHRQQPHQRPQPQLGARAAPQPGARDRQLVQERLGRRSQLQDRRRDLRRDASRTSSSTASRKTSCT